LNQQELFNHNLIGQSEPWGSVRPDYRDLSERFDRIVSVGMFEYVGSITTGPLRKMRRAAEARRRHAVPCDRTFRAACRHRHLPFIRIFPGA
jgi:hypothetical protein